MDEKTVEQKPVDSDSCNCQNEFISTPCPVHGATPRVGNHKYGQEPIVITDDDLSPEIWGVYEGFKFICPHCRVPSIMINQDIGAGCCSCLRPVILRSKQVTDYLRSRYSKKGE